MCYIGLNFRKDEDQLLRDDAHDLIQGAGLIVRNHALQQSDRPIENRKYYLPGRLESETRAEDATLAGIWTAIAFVSRRCLLAYVSGSHFSYTTSAAGKAVTIWHAEPCPITPQNLSLQVLDIGDVSWFVS
jgi:hypothetical protein